RVLRPGRRSALAVGLRLRARWAGQGVLARPHGLAVRPREHQRRAVRPGPAGGPGHPGGRPAGPAVARAEPRSAAGPRRADLVVLVGRGDRVLLGEPRAGVVAAPRDLVDQLDLPP